MYNYFLQIYAQDIELHGEDAKLQWIKSSHDVVRHNASSSISSLLHIYKVLQISVYNNSLEARAY